MIVLDDFQQKDRETGYPTPEWMAARLAVVTSSAMAPLMVKPGPKSEDALGVGARTYCIRLAVEHFVRQPCDTSFSSPWMKRGEALEPKARDWYALTRGVAVKEVGFIYSDETRRVGASTDGLIYDEDPCKPAGVLEIKTPSALVHGTCTLDPNKFADEHRHQVQSELFVTGLPWADLVSFNPSQPDAQLVMRCGRDVDYQDHLEQRVEVFLEQLQIAIERLAELGWKRTDAYCTRPLDEDGRWCLSRKNLTETPLGWRCSKHNG